MYKLHRCKETYSLINTVTFMLLIRKKYKHYLRNKSYDLLLYYCNRYYFGLKMHECTIDHRNLPKYSLQFQNFS